MRPCIIHNKRIFIICYVNDFIVFADTLDQLESFRSQFSLNIDIKNLSCAIQFLIIELDCSSICCALMKQLNIIQRFLTKAVILYLKPVDSFVDPSFSHDEAMKSEPLPPDEHSTCQSRDGRLLYLSRNTKSELLSYGQFALFQRGSAPYTSQARNQARSTIPKDNSGL